MALTRKFPVNVELFNCPRCGGMYLHHGAVCVFARPEDGDTVAVAKVTADGTSSTRVVDSADSGNPSARRGGITIAFSCEECGDGLTLCIAQHKGITEIWWTMP